MKDCGSLQRAQKGRETCPFRALDGFNEIRLTLLERMAGTTRLELATSAVTASFDTTRYRRSLLIVPSLYPDRALSTRPAIVGFLDVSCARHPALACSP